MSKETETVPVTVTVELPKNIHSLLKDFSKLANNTLEELLKEELEQIVRDFYSGGFFEKWVKKAFKDRGVAEYFEIPV